MKVLSCTAAGYGYIGRVQLELEGEAAWWIPTRASKPIECLGCCAPIEQYEACWRALQPVTPDRVCERCCMTALQAT